MKSVEYYESKFWSLLPPAPPRLPVNYRDFDDVVNRLIAWEKIDVQRWNREFLKDRNTLTNIEKAANWICSSASRTLLISGPTGNGKSTLLKAIHRLFWENGSVYVHAQDIFDVMRETDGQLKHHNAPLLCIDELGNEPIKYMKYGEEGFPLKKLLFHRLENKKTMVIVTNLEPEDLVKLYGERVYDRLLGNSEVILIDAPSYRK